jgi:hypothetical protein
MTIQLPITDDEAAAPIKAFLADFGILPADYDRYDTDAVLKAIRSRGWEPVLTQSPEGLWTSEIREWRSIDRSRLAVGHGDDPVSTLFDALGFALTWSTNDEALQDFDRQTRAMLDLGAVEFLSRWSLNELDLNDPRVVHLLIGRPLGR